MKHVLITLCSATLLALTACNDQPAKQDEATATVQPGVKEENVTYNGDSATMNGFIAFDSSITGKRPAVLIIPEWWGLTDYPKMRARELAKMGYIALAMDMYGDGKIADNPQQAKAFADPFYGNPQKAKARIDAALALLKSQAQTDADKVAIIGYCFGGGMALNVARLGEPVKGVVSFHGSLIGTPANKDLLTAKVLVCHGGADTFVKPEEVAAFKKQMDSIKADYTFKEYPGATHAFTNPTATETGKKFNMPITYNGAADTASWNDMKSFFDVIFK